ncbi:MAG: hydrogenase expression/formation protein HypE [bacterium]
MDEKILLAHGSGGTLSQRLIEAHFLPSLQNPILNLLDDGAILDFNGLRLCMSTDTYVVDPIFFPGGDIGKLAVCGTINDLCMCGGKPLYLSIAVIIEEGFSMADLDRIIASIANTANAAEVHVITGDTKVVPHGKGDKIFINSTGIGHVVYSGTISGTNARTGDIIILSGTIGDHGMAVMSQREGLRFSGEIMSDVAHLNEMVGGILDISSNIHCMRDPTRGGIASVLNEIANKSKKRFLIDEETIPVRPQVRGACEILGIDPMYVANEGKMLAIVAPEDAEKVLDKIRSHTLGKEAAIIGKVGEDSDGEVILNTLIGGKRILDRPTGEILPRIC